MIGLGEISLEEAEFVMRPRTVTEVEVQLQKADPSIDVMKLVKARPHHTACGCSADTPMHGTSPKGLEMVVSLPCLPAGAKKRKEAAEYGHCYQAQHLVCRQAHESDRKIGAFWIVLGQP